MLQTKYKKMFSNFILITLVICTSFLFTANAWCTNDPGSISGFESKSDSDWADDIDESTVKNSYDRYEIEESKGLPSWRTNNGMSSAIMLRLYTLLANDKTIYHLKNVVSDERVTDILGPTFCFKNKHGDRFILLLPDDACHRIDYDSKWSYSHEQKLKKSNFYTVLSNIKNYANQSANNTRFVIPIHEKSVYGGIMHSVLLCIDYDAASRNFYSAIFDSIDRGGIQESIARWWRWEKRLVCDQEIQYMLADVLGSASVNMVRYDYGAQSRTRDGNCGSYTFACIKSAIDCFIGIGNFEPVVEYMMQNITNQRTWLKELEDRIAKCFKKSDLEPLRHLSHANIQDEFKVVFHDANSIQSNFPGNYYAS